MQNLVVLGVLVPEIFYVESSDGDLDAFITLMMMMDDECVW